jgi:hypothetical protein
MGELLRHPRHFQQWHKKQVRIPISTRQQYLWKSHDVRASGRGGGLFGELRECDCHFTAQNFSSKKTIEFYARSNCSPPESAQM